MKIAFVSPRLPANGAVGGAETLLLNLAILAKGAGFDVTFLTTCAKNHHTWANEEPEGPVTCQGIKAIRFPVNSNRNIEAFLSIQSRISQGEAVSDYDEQIWMQNSVTSDALLSHIKSTSYDRIIVGPYLFGLTLSVATIAPEKTILVPCLHDEAFARVRLIAKMFQTIRGSIFNTEPERLLAKALYGQEILSPTRPSTVVGFALDDFPSSPERGHKLAGIASPYIIYCGRREPLKGTPLIIDYWAAFRHHHPEIDLKLLLTGSGAIDIPTGMENHLIDKGFVSEQDKHDLLAGALCFCHASQNESLGIVLLESWLAHRPVLVHAKGIVLQDQTQRANGGLWFRDFPEFCASLEFLLSHPTYATTLGENGRNFTLREYAASTVRTRLTTTLTL